MHYGICIAVEKKAVGNLNIGQTVLKKSSLQNLWQSIANDFCSPGVLFRFALF